MCVLRRTIDVDTLSLTANHRLNLISLELTSMRRRIHQMLMNIESTTVLIEKIQSRV